MRSVLFKNTTTAAITASALACLSLPSAVMAQDAVRLADPFADEDDRPATVSDMLLRLERDGSFSDFDAPITDIEPRWVATVSQGDRTTPRAVSERDVWFSGGGFNDRLRLRTEGSLRRADGAPVPPGPQDRAGWDTEHYDVTYVRGWTENLGQTASGLDVTLTPHVGFGVGSRGNSTEAGAILRIGRNLERLVPDGAETFGERPRWYVYAAGSGRAVGYNFARTRDGDYARSGISHDSGDFLGDASIGVAMRKGPVQGSIGLVYREIETEGLHAGHGVDTDVSEGVIAFQLSIRPQ